jgi:hypothetical protein
MGADARNEQRAIWPVLDPKGQINRDFPRWPAQRGEVPCHPIAGNGLDPIPR